MARILDQDADNEDIDFDELSDDVEDIIDILEGLMTWSDGNDEIQTALTA